MTKLERENLVRRNLRSNPNSMIDTETGLQAIRRIAEIADRENVEWALAGGIAMHVYGSPRLTKDADVIASPRLSIAATRQLGFGGERYIIRVGTREIDVDWIVRRDDAQAFYQAALRDAIKIDDVKILTAEWLIITKYIAGRFKDQEDAIFLLRQADLVDRKLIKAHYVEIGGGVLWAAVSSGYFRWFDLADNKHTPDGDENASYRKL